MGCCCPQTPHVQQTTSYNNIATDGNNSIPLEVAVHNTKVKKELEVNVPDFDELIFAVGKNIYNECGLDFLYDNTMLTQLPDQIQQLQAKYIHCGDSYTIYATQNHDQMLYLPHPPEAARQAGAWRFEWPFVLPRTSIRQIFCNVNGKCTFWITEDNKVFGFGSNEWAALGLGHSLSSSSMPPVMIPIRFFSEKVSNVMDIQTASNNYSFALCSRNDAKTHILVECWASLRELYCPPEIVKLILNFYNTHYNLYSVGFSLMGSSAYWKPIKALTAVNICKIATGFDHSVFLEVNGTVWCVGDNKFGQLGLGHLNMITLPTKITYFVENKIVIKDIKCGHDHCLALTMDGNVYSWGHNGAGQCGDGTAYHIKRPKLISLFDDNAIEIVEIGCGGYHSFCKSSQDKYYLFGGNKYNECVIYDQTQYIVLLPCCINDIVKEKCEGRVIKSVHLGNSNTKLILCASN